MFRSPVPIDKIVSERQIIEVKQNLNLTIVIKYIGLFFQIPWILFEKPGHTCTVYDIQVRVQSV